MRATGSGRDEAVIRALRAESERRWQARRRRRALIAQVGLCVVVPALYIGAGVALTTRCKVPPRAPSPAVSPTQQQPLITPLPPPVCPNDDGLEDDERVAAVTRDFRSMRLAALRSTPTPRSTLAQRSALAGSDIARGINDIRRRIARCAEAAPSSRGVVRVTAVIAPSGFVTRTRVTSSSAGTAVGRCVAAAVATAEFPLSNRSVTTEIPVVLYPAGRPSACPETVTEQRLRRQQMHTMELITHP